MNRTSRCCWLNFCLLTTVEFWTPKEDSIAVEGGVLAFCQKHRLAGEERIRVCQRVRYDVAIHQQSILDHFDVFTSPSFGV